VLDVEAQVTNAEGKSGRDVLKEVVVAGLRGTCEGQRERRLPHDSDRFGPGCAIDQEDIRDVELWLLGLTRSAWAVVSDYCVADFVPIGDHFVDLDADVLGELNKRVAG